MKQIIPASLFIIFAAGALAQQKADLIVGYDVTFVNWYNDSPRTIKMSLLMNSRESKYFDEVAQWTDSLLSSPDGKRQHEEIIMATCVEKAPDGSILSIDLSKGPVPKSDTYVINNLPESTLTFYDKFGTENIFYTEPIAEMVWQMSDSTANIMGYECNSATCDYHGRRWTAWFAPELPLPFGPWKLRGLPGLILKAESDNGTTFVVNGLQKSDRVISPVYRKEQYDKVERKKALADLEYFETHRESVLSARSGGRVSIKSNNDKKDYDRQKYALEPDYK